MEIEMKIRGLMMDPMTNLPVVILKEACGNGILPIWVGVHEANAIALEIERVVTPRPMTHDLLKNVLLGMNAYVHKVVVTAIRDETFYAVIWIDREGALVSIDSRRFAEHYGKLCAHVSGRAASSCFRSAICCLFSEKNRVARYFHGYRRLPDLAGDAAGRTLRHHQRPFFLCHPAQLVCGNASGDWHSYLLPRYGSPMDLGPGTYAARLVQPLCRQHSGRDCRCSLGRVGLAAHGRLRAHGLDLWNNCRTRVIGNQFRKTASLDCFSGCAFTGRCHR